MIQSATCRHVTAGAARLATGVAHDLGDRRNCWQNDGHSRHSEGPSAGNFAESPLNPSSERTCRIAQAEKWRPSTLADQKPRTSSRLGGAEGQGCRVRIAGRQQAIERVLGSPNLPARCVNHPCLGMVWSLRRLLGVAPHLHANGYRLNANRGRLGCDAPFRKTVLMASGFLRGATFPVDRDGADHRNDQDQNPAEKLQSPDR
jgi:hypothetical protein